ncbi:hypothetical protein SO694_00035234 [Aureococcus anophagefferens]|uniref:Uncharacterized protein n=1 Tax=Aureococcus anophagefferens TaxID=44056 RepID=A0ABR1FKQ7_AURAN
MVFPLGLSLIVLSKSELVTANFLTQYLPKPSPDALRVLSVSFAANLAGSLAMVGLASSACLFTPGAAAPRQGRLGQGRPRAVRRLPQGRRRELAREPGRLPGREPLTAPGKIAALWLPIMTFITLNLEHPSPTCSSCPWRSALGAEFTVADMAANIGVVAAGNAAGAVLLVGMLRSPALRRAEVGDERPRRGPSRGAPPPAHKKNRIVAGFIWGRRCSRAWPSRFGTGESNV